MKTFIVLLSILFLIPTSFCFGAEIVDSLYTEGLPKDCDGGWPEGEQFRSINDDGIDRTMAVPYYDPMKLSPLTKVIGDTAYIKIFSSLTQTDEIAVYDDLQILEHNPEVTKIKVYLNSPGGVAYAGFAIGDQFIRVKDRFEMSVWASGTVASAAVVVFAAFENRFASRNTIFMVHEVAVPQTAGMDRTDVKNMEEMFGQLTDRYIDILVNITNKSKEEWEQLLKDETYFFASEAKEWGLVTEVK